LDPNIVWYLFFLDEAADKVEVGVAGCRVGNLDLLHSSFDDGVEEGRFLLNSHRIGQGLVSISEICGEPDGCPLECLRWPLAILEVQGCVRLVLLGWVCTGV
jgi:hypothetical protein